MLLSFRTARSDMFMTDALTHLLCCEGLGLKIEHHRRNDLLLPSIFLLKPCLTTWMKLSDSVTFPLWCQAPLFLHEHVCYNRVYLPSWLTIWMGEIDGASFAEKREARWQSNSAFPLAM